MIQLFEDYFDQFVKALLLICVFSLITVSVGSVFLRWFNISFLWLDPFIRHIVLLSAFLGGCLATSNGTHIAINIFDNYLKKTNPRLVRYLQGGIQLLCSIVCFILFKVSYSFSLIEFEYGQEKFWGIHSGYLVSIIPFGFSLLAIRFLLAMFSNKNKGDAWKA